MQTALESSQAQCNMFEDGVHDADLQRKNGLLQQALHNEGERYEALAQRLTECVDAYEDLVRSHSARLCDCLWNMHATA